MEFLHIEAAFLALYFASLLLGLVAHESGHAAVAWLVGFKVRMIRIGTGAAWFRARLGTAAWLVVRRWPFGGAVTMLTRSPERVGASLAMVLAGMGANALLLAAVAVVWAVQGRRGMAWAVEHDDLVGAFWLFPIGFAQALMIVATAFPYVARSSGVSMQSDGLRVWRLLRDPGFEDTAKLRAILLRTLLPDAPSPPPAPPPEAAEIVYQVTRPEVLTDPWACRDAAEVLRGVLARGDRLPDADRALVLVCLASYAQLPGGAGASPEELDAWSSEAVALAPSPPTWVTRGGALVLLDRHAEAEALLRPLVAQADAAGLGAICRFWLATAAGAAGGDLEAARRLARRAGAMAREPRQARILAALTDRLEEAARELEARLAALPGDGLPSPDG